MSRCYSAIRPCSRKWSRRWQVAPTILRALGYDPAELKAVKIEGTQELPVLANGKLSAN